MNTKQMLEDFWNDVIEVSPSSINNETICIVTDDNMHNFTRKLIESVVEEIIGNSGENYIEWRVYVEKQYADGRKDSKERLILGFPEWLEEKQRLKVKEILSNLK